MRWEPESKKKGYKGENHTRCEATHARRCGASVAANREGADLQTGEEEEGTEAKP